MFCFRLSKDRDSILSDPVSVRAHNDQASRVDRNFLAPVSGLPGRSNTDYRHLIIAPATNNQYGAGTFPGIEGNHWVNNYPESNRTVVTERRSNWVSMV